MTNNLKNARMNRSAFAILEPPTRFGLQIFVIIHDTALSSLFRYQSAMFCFTIRPTETKLKTKIRSFIFGLYGNQGRARRISSGKETNFGSFSNQPHFRFCRHFLFNDPSVKRMSNLEVQKIIQVRYSL